MASPRKRLSDAEDLTPSHPQFQGNGSATLDSAPRKWRFAYAWMVLALLLAFWYIGFGWGDSGGWIWGHRNASATGATAGDLNAGLVILEVANKQDYIGQSFQIRNVAVDHWSSDQAVWIGSRHSYLPMLLVFPAASPLAPRAVGPTGSGSSAGASAGTGTGAKVLYLNVSGKVMKAPPTAQAQQQWKLSDDDVDQLEQEGVYILATGVQQDKR